MAKAKQYTTRALTEMGYLPKRKLRKAIAALRKKSPGQLPKRLETAMRNQRSALAAFGLVIESSDRHEAFYVPELAVVWDAYLRWHDFGTKRTVIQGTLFMKDLLNAEHEVMHYIAGPHRDEFMDFIVKRLGTGKPRRTFRPLELVHSDKAAS